MKRIKSALLILAFVIGIVGTSSIVSAAMVYTSINTKQKTWYTQKNDTYSGDNYVQYCYRIYMPYSGELKLEISNLPKYGNVSIYDAKPTQKMFESDDDHHIVYASVSGLRLGLDKGAYYLMAPEKVKFKYTITKRTFGGNYSRAKASSLAKNVKRNVTQTSLHNYNRWYKIKLTAKQRVTVWTNTGFYVDIRDSRGRWISATTQKATKSMRIISEKILPAGTYYIIMKAVDYSSCPYDFLEDGYQSGEFYWK